MKKLPVILLASVAIAAIAALIIHMITEHKPERRLFARRNAFRTSRKFPGFNFDLQLNENTQGGEAEFAALQTMLNAYLGADVVPVSASWNPETAQALWEITGRDTTSLYYFRYYFFVPKYGDNAAIEILRDLTDTN